MKARNRTKIRKNKVLETVDSVVQRFLEGVEKNSKVFMVYDDDGDGICSASIFRKILDAKGVKLSSMPADPRDHVTKKMVDEIVSVNPTHVILLDIPFVERNLLKKLSSSSKVLIVDHHMVHHYEEVAYANPRTIKEDLYMPTSCLAYFSSKRFFDKNLSWLGAVGVLSDHGFNDCRFVLEDLRSTYPELLEGARRFTHKELFEKTKLGVMAKMISASITVKGNEGAKLSFEIFSTMDWRGIIEGKGKAAELHKLVEIFERELLKFVEEFKSRAKDYGKFLYFEFSSPYRIKSSLASMLSTKHKKVIVLGQVIGNSLSISVRGRGYDLGSIMKKVCGAVGGHGGGHPQAAGGSIPLDKKEEFLEEFSKALN